MGSKKMRTFFFFEIRWNLLREFKNLQKQVFGNWPVGLNWRMDFRPAIKVLQKIGVDTGGANVQFAIHPKTGRTG